MGKKKKTNRRRQLWSGKERFFHDEKNAHKNIAAQRAGN